MKLDDFLVHLRKLCGQAGGQAAWAKQHGISPSYVGDVLNGRREPGPQICAAAGVERVITYRKVRK